MNNHILPTLIVSGITVLLIAGCSSESNGPEQSDEATATHQTMDHSTMDHSRMAAQVPASTPAGVAEAKGYPLTICLVSGEKLGEMGEPQRLVYEGQEMKFCCNDCIKEFQADPTKYMAKLAEASAKPMMMPSEGMDHSQH